MPFRVVAPHSCPPAGWTSSLVCTHAWDHAHVDASGPNPPPAAAARTASLLPPPTICAANNAPVCVQQCVAVITFVLPVRGALAHLPAFSALASKCSHCTARGSHCSDMLPAVCALVVVLCAASSSDTPRNAMLADFASRDAT